MPAFIFSTCNLSLAFGRVAFPEIDGFITSRLVVGLAAPCGRGIMDTKGSLGKREGSDRTFSLPATSHRESGTGSSHLIPSRPAVNSPSASGVYSYVPGKPILLRFVPGEGISLYRAPYKLYGSFKKCVSVTKKFNIVIHDSWVHLRGRCWDSWLVEYADRWFRECGHLCVPHLTRGYRRRCRPLE